MQKNKVLTAAQQRKRFEKFYASPEIRLTRCQIKSVRVAREVAALLQELEELVGIRETYITLDDCFICPNITDKQIRSLNASPGETTLRDILLFLRGSRVRAPKRATTKSSKSASRSSRKKG